MDQFVFMSLRKKAARRNTPRDFLLQLGRDYAAGCKSDHGSDGDGHQIIYTISGSRKVHLFPQAKNTCEPSPHAAGSFHDPEHHQTLMDRVEEFIKKGQTQ